MSTTTDIKFEFYIDSTSDQDTSTDLSPADATDLGLNSGIVVDQLGGGITFSNAGSIKGGKLTGMQVQASGQVTKTKIIKLQQATLPTKK